MKERDRTDVKTVEKLVQEDIVLVAEEVDWLKATSAILEAGVDVSLALIVLAHLEGKCRRISCYIYLD